MEEEKLPELVVNEEPEEDRECEFCEKPESEDHKLLDCSRCQLVSYCGPECQQAHWIAFCGHKAMCIEVGVKETKKATVADFLESKSNNIHGSSSQSHEDDLARMKKSTRNKNMGIQTEYGPKKFIKP